MVIIGTPHDWSFWAFPSNLCNILTDQCKPVAGVRHPTMSSVVNTGLIRVSVSSLCYQLEGSLPVQWLPKPELVGEIKRFDSISLMSRRLGGYS